MISLGLDVSELRLGWAFVDYDDQRPLSLGVEDLRKPGGGWPEDQVITAMRDVRDRLRALGHDPEEVGIIGVEDAYLGPGGPRALARASGVIGMARAMAVYFFGRQAGVYMLGADEWRAACGISTAGKREDKKRQTMYWAAEILDGPDGFIQDEADALGLATAASLLTVKRSEEAA